MAQVMGVPDLKAGRLAHLLNQTLDLALAERPEASFLGGGKQQIQRPSPALLQILFLQVPHIVLELVHQKRRQIHAAGLAEFGFFEAYEIVAFGDMVSHLVDIQMAKPHGERFPQPQAGIGYGL